MLAIFTGVRPMKFSSKTLFAAVSLPIMLSACTGNADDNSIVTEQDLQHHHWELTKIDGKQVNSDSKVPAASLEIGEKMTANGSAGCNNFFGQSELENGKFRIKQMGMTMKMCPEESMAIESAVSQTLSDWSQLTLTKESLILKNDSHTLTYTLRDWMN